MVATHAELRPVGHYMTDISMMCWSILFHYSTMTEIVDLIIFDYVNLVDLHFMSYSLPDLHQGR